MDIEIDDFEDALVDSVTESEFDIDCPNCGRVFDIKLENVGSSVTCPYCSQIITFESE